MYSEFFLLIKDYLSTMNQRTFVFDWCVPFIISIVVCSGFESTTYSTKLSNLVPTIIALLGVLIGFSMTVTTVLTTGTSRNLNEIKEKKTSIKIDGVKVSLFRMLLTNLSYSIVMEIFVLLTLLIVSNFWTMMGYILSLSIFGILTLFLSNILLVLLRNTTSLYFVLTK